MRFLMMVRNKADSLARYEAGEGPDPELVGKMMKYNEELVRAGALISGEGLHPSKHAARIEFGKGGKPTIVDGPFSEAKELIGGFWIVRFGTREEAVAWAARAPLPEGNEIELREIYDIADHKPEVAKQALEFAEKRHKIETGTE